MAMLRSFMHALMIVLWDPPIGAVLSAIAILSLAMAIRGGRPVPSRRWFLFAWPAFAGPSMVWAGVIARQHGGAGSAATTLNNGLWIGWAGCVAVVMVSKGSRWLAASVMAVGMIFVATCYVYVWDGLTWSFG